MNEFITFLIVALIVVAIIGIISIIKVAQITNSNLARIFVRFATIKLVFLYPGGETGAREIG